MQPPQGVRIVITHIENPQSFWYRRESPVPENVNILKRVEKDIIEAVSNYKQCKNPKFDVGDIVAIFVKQYDKWIRAKVQEMQKENVLVWALDYGEPISVQAGALIPLKGTNVPDSNGVGINKGGLCKCQPAKRVRYKIAYIL